MNGGLFVDEDVVIPPFTDEIRELLLTRASAEFDWSAISPTIFGAVFESTLNPETRRSGGMHYTSIENIHKVIDPLFLDDLKKELEEISSISIAKTKVRKLKEYQTKLASLGFLDPAAGSGNFLTESYLCVRRLENDVLRLLSGGQVALGDSLMNPIQVSISQFHGIEINDFAVTVAKTALWIAESQMMKETEDIIYTTLEFLPLKTNANIVEGNALRMDWNDVVAKERLDYIMGNPPFVGAQYMDKAQKSDIMSIFSGNKKAGLLDYVAAWYKKACDYIIVPSASSERRRYIPLGFFYGNTISTNLNLIIPDATIYNFGILTSNVHMAWMRAICGRLKSDYRYSKDVVYNNFPWPNPTEDQKQKIEQTAQEILKARSKYSDASLADLYDDLTMPPELRTAHQNNDRAVMAAYGFPIKGFTESDCVAELMKLYQKMNGKA